MSKANDWFTKYGTWSVLIGRVIPVVRSLISIPAGFNPHELPALHRPHPAQLSRVDTISFPPVTYSATSGRSRFKGARRVRGQWSSRP